MVTNGSQRETRRKTSMLLHQLEEALGNFVLDNGNAESLSLDSLENIHRRELDKGRVFNKSSIKDIVEATYLEELFRFARDIAQDSSQAASIDYLYSLFHHLDIFEVRNAVAHPNRPFWDCYWYRVAAIASDPVNEILGLGDVKSALAAAEAGSIQDPPVEWINKVIWQIPNNLPTQFDHGLTGLIGRTRELSELKKYVSNSRVNVIALVAPGGAGKTALALDLLNNLVSTPSYTKFIDAVIFITMKTEKLTAGGIVSLDSIQTIEELKQNIVESLNLVYDEDHVTFEEAVKSYGTQKVLLCLDNLETLLREDQASFDELNFELPPSWKILVTSRVSVSNSTTLSLDALKEKSAVHLARTYLAKRGGNQLPPATYERVASGCFFNPLAIRLTLDLVVAGHDIPNSLSSANKEIAEFSYNNLIQALSSDSIEILEAVFVEDASTRLSLCELLDKNLDQISSAIGELSKTSLVTRTSTEDGEAFGLSDSVRDLLVISPRNIAIRNTVQERVHKRRVLSKEIDIRQEDRELAEWHADYIPKNAGENLKILVTEVNRNLKKASRETEIAVRLFRKLKDAKFIHEGHSCYHRAYGRVLECLKDYKSAEEQFLSAQRTEPESPSATFLLARLYHSTKRYDEAHSEYQKLIDSGWTAEKASLESFGRSIISGYCLALLFSGNHDKVFEVTKDWKKSARYRGVLGTFRASAWKRKMEGLVNDDTETTVDCLIRASRILADIFRNEGYFRTANRQASSVFKEIEFCFSRPLYCEKHPKEGLELLNFVASHIVEIAQTERDYSLELAAKCAAIRLPNNPLTQDRLKAFLSKDRFELEDEFREPPVGLIAVKVTKRPNTASFLFAKDAYGTSYFLHFSAFRDGDWKAWVQLSVGTTLDITADNDTIEPNRATSAKEIYIPR